ncbi:hypothetical protein [Devosia sp. DBB001]|nr:hypothetical protein [Devosia sp. DBB001]
MDQHHIVGPDAQPAEVAGKTVGRDRLMGPFNHICNGHGLTERLALPARRVVLPMPSARPPSY